MLTPSIHPPQRSGWSWMSGGAAGEGGSPRREWKHILEKCVYSVGCILQTSVVCQQGRHPKVQEYERRVCCGPKISKLRLVCLDYRTLLDHIHGHGAAI